MKAWRKCYEDGYHAIRKDSEKGNPESDYLAFDILYRSFVKRVGHEPDFESYLNSLKEYNKAVAAYVKSRKKINGTEVHDRTKLKKINILLAKIKNFEKGGDSTTISEVLTSISMNRKVPMIQEKDLTVLAYFNLLKEYQRWQKAK